MKMLLSHGPLSYVEKGSGRPYLLINGLPFASAEYADVLDVLSWSSRAIAVDLPGIAGSAPLPEPTPAALAEALLSAIARLGIDSFILAVTDVAGPVGCEILRNQPGLVAGVLFFNTLIVPTGLNLPRYMDRSKTTIVDLIRPSRRLENEILCLMGKGEKFEGDILETALSNLTRPARKIGADLFARAKQAPFLEYHEILKQFQKPIRILWGEMDTLFPRNQFENFRRLLPDAHAELREGVGHFLGIEDANRLTESLQDLGREAWN